MAITPLSNQPTFAPGRIANHRIGRAVLFALGLGALLLIAWLVYRPGLRGAFLLDDFSNLNALDALGATPTWHSFLRFITSGTADPTGRPLSLATFMLDAQSWPATAAPFKYTNVLLHLLNGVLLCWSMLALGKRLGLTETRAAIAALFASGVWMLHPLFVSTTLYVVQREAMLPATFTFVGILSWCAGRNAIDSGRKSSGIALMTFGAWGCTLLATLCKANGILIPLLLVIAEITVLRQPKGVHPPRHQPFRAVRWTLLGPPLAVLAAYAIYVIPGTVFNTPIERPWTVGQRLLTEPRMLMDYLKLLWIPSSTSYGVFYDQVRASTDWLHPWTTLPCIIAVVGLVAIGWLTRKRCPTIAFAILFYFAGQVLESSFIPLELAFEHRNYLPAAFMFWPIGVWLARRPAIPWLAHGASCAVLIVLALMTWTRAGVWGNLQLQARIWGRINPDSPQAQSFAAAVEAASGNLGASIARLRAATIRMPDSAQLPLRLIDTECRAGTVSPDAWQLAFHALRQTRTQWNNIANWITTTAPRAAAHPCNGLTPDRLVLVLRSVQSNPKFTRWKPHEPAFLQASANVSLAQGQPQQAIAAFDTQLGKSPYAATAITQIETLSAFGYPTLALRYLDRVSSTPFRRHEGSGMAALHAYVLASQNWWPRQFSALRTRLQGALARRSAERHANNDERIQRREGPGGEGRPSLAEGP